MTRRSFFSKVAGVIAAPFVARKLPCPEKVWYPKLTKAQWPSVGSGGAGGVGHGTIVIAGNSIRRMREQLNNQQLYKVLDGVWVYEPKKLLS